MVSCYAKQHSVNGVVWNAISPLFPKKWKSNDNRLSIDAVYWIAKTEALWRDTT